jgi:hypothetical protein
MITWRMRLACFITKTTHAHSEYVKLVLFHRNNGCMKAPKCYVVRVLLDINFMFMFLVFCEPLSMSQNNVF